MSRRPVGSCKNVMEDCRAFTDYRPNCQLNEELKNKYAPNASSEYRLFLQHNACAIQEERRKFSQELNKNPTGCVCNFDHRPHDPASQVKYHWQPSSKFLGQKNKDFNRPIPSPAQGNWTNFC